MQICAQIPGQLCFREVWVALLPEPAAYNMGFDAELELPKQEGISVRFPGVVKNDTRALKMLGGAKDVSDALHAGTMLRCYLRPDVRPSATFAPARFRTT